MAKKAERSVTFDAKGLQIDGAPTPLVAGSLEYWRAISLFWRRSLKEMKRAGLDLMSSFVCWDFHELEDGSLDFVGASHPSRDLAGFIDMCSDEGFDYLLRVGPIIDAEWPTRGPSIDVCQLERIDPRYRERTEEYLDGLLEHIVPRLATNGGPIVMVAVDNEPYFPYSTDAESDPSEGSIHVPYARDLVLSNYADWLRERYGGDEGLRAAWDDATARLDSLKDPDYRSDSTRAILDSFEFMTDTIGETLAWMRDFCRERGVDVPIYSNSKPLSQYIGWSEIEDIVDGHGIGMFFSNLIPDDQSLVASWYVRLARAVTRFPWAAEFQSLAPMGQEEVFGVLSDDHQRYITELAVALGLRGFGYYVFVERDDAQGAPISPLGKVRPRLEQVKKGIVMAKSVHADRQLYDVGLLWSYDHHRLRMAERFDDWEKLYHVWIDMDVPQELADWWDIFRQLHAGDIDFAIVPMSRAGSTPVLIYAGPDEVRPSELARVVEAVEAGATLLVKRLPTKSVSGDHGEVEDLCRRLQESGRLVLLEHGNLGDTLAELDIHTPISSGATDVWSSAYETDEAYYFFVANVGEDVRKAQVRLRADLVQAVSGSEARDLESGETWSPRGESLFDGELELDGKHVRGVTVTKGD